MQLTWIVTLPAAVCVQAEMEPGVFCGLALDQDNQDDLTEKRIAEWTSQVLQEMNVKVAA